MKHLSSEAQRLIAQTRKLDEPSLDDRVRVRTRLDASWSTSPLARDTGATGLGGKLWLTGLSISVLAGIGIWLASTPARQPLAMNRAPLVQPAVPSSQPRAAQLSGADTQELSTGVAPTNIPGARAQPSNEPDELRVAAPRRARVKSRQQAAQSTVDAPALRATAAPQPMAADAPARRAAASPQPADTAPLPATASPHPKAAAEQLAAEPLSAAQPDAQMAQAQARQSRRPSVSATSAPVPMQAVDESAEAFVPDPIADEVSLLGAAQEALREGQPTRAMNYIRQHAFRFPTGALAQERSAVHALALCALDRKSAARQVFADLQRRAPSAAVLARIRQDCGFD